MDDSLFSNNIAIAGIDPETIHDNRIFLDDEFSNTGVELKSTRCLLCTSRKATKTIQYEQVVEPPAIGSTRSSMVTLSCCRRCQLNQLVLSSLISSSSGLAWLFATVGFGGLGAGALLNGGAYVLLLGLVCLAALGITLVFMKLASLLPQFSRPVDILSWTFGRPLLGTTDSVEKVLRFERSYRIRDDADIERLREELASSA